MFPGLSDVSMRKIQYFEGWEDGRREQMITYTSQVNRMRSDLITWSCIHSDTSGVFFVCVCRALHVYTEKARRSDSEN